MQIIMKHQLKLNSSANTMEKAAGSYSKSNNNKSKLL